MINILNKNLTKEVITSEHGRVEMTNSSEEDKKKYRQYLGQLTSDFEGLTEVMKSSFTKMQKDMDKKTKEIIDDSTAASKKQDVEDIEKIKKAIND